MISGLIRRSGVALMVGAMAVAGLGAMQPSLVLPVASALTGAPTAAEAAIQDFVLTNALPGTITQIFLTASANSTWGSNVLNGSVPSGASAPVTFGDNYPESVCQHDIRIEVDGATTWDVMGIDLCATHAITFVPNEAGGVNYVVTPAQ